MDPTSGIDNIDRTISWKRNQAPQRSILALVCSLFFGGILLAAAGDLPTLDLPARATNALSGREFAQRAASLSLAEREQAVFREITSGNVPEFLRRLCPIQVTNTIENQTNIATFYVTPDYLAVGSDADYVLMPISPSLAQKIADELNGSLPTRRMVDLIYKAAEVKLKPAPIAPSAAMITVAVFSNHNAIVRQQRAEQLSMHPLGALVAGHKKDLVLTPRLAQAPGKVAIYGWHRTNGEPIQPLYLGHTNTWVDYSQCARLVSQKMVVNGKATTVAQVLSDPVLAPLLSDEGTLQNSRYPILDVANPSSDPTNSRSTDADSSSGGFHAGSAFGERIASFTLEPEVKVLINAPNQFPASNKVQLILYALPNGNTIDQTIGRKLKPGEDWHFDIQHIGAQTRFLRELLPDRIIVIAYLEAEQKSWPAWRKSHGDKGIPGLVNSLLKIFATNEVELVLSGHSGGGSFIFGYLNAVSGIPAQITRIAFLDSDYAYERSAGHGKKIAKWLWDSEQHYLCVLAYDDASALLDGKSFVSATGGTWGRSHALWQDLAGDFKFSNRTNAEFELGSALNGRAQFILKLNPERKVLHTIQVERNGFIHSMVLGTANEGKGYEYFGERAYSKWIADPSP